MYSVVVIDDTRIAVEAICPFYGLGSMWLSRWQEVLYDGVAGLRLIEEVQPDICGNRHSDAWI